MRNNVITIEMLNKIDICKQGKKWFRRNYPDGLKITKQNITESLEKINRLRNLFSLHGESYSVVKTLKDMRGNPDYDGLDTTELLKAKQREDRFDNTANVASYGLDALYNAIGVEEGGVIYETMDLWYTREDMSAKGDLSSIINSVWSDVQVYRDYLAEIYQQ